MNPFLFAPAPGDPASLLTSFGPLVALFLVFYFLLIRPTAKRQREHEALLKSLEKGVKIVTSGGIIGTIANVKGDVVSLKVTDNVKIDVIKSNIAHAYAPKKSN
jgi:preprotein translocase subunit YajC